VSGDISTDPVGRRTLRTVVVRLLSDERVRFLIVGGVNTVLGYALFALFDLTIGRWIGYIGSLYLSYVIAIGVAFVLHRRFTFRVGGTGNAVVDFLRFVSVYVVALAINTIALPILVEVVHIPPLPAQALVVILTTLLSYFGHKFFSFRRARRDAIEPDVD
jgi:putative flippase GtrA